MSTPAGRGLRVALGVALIALGLSMGSPAGWAIAAFGVLPLATGVADVCPVCPMLSDDRRAAAGCRGASCS